jgi:acetyl-CoA carboxylase biotin carboxyl carrier protein
MTQIRAPMVGKVIEVLVQVGSAVGEDDELMILESMKMEIPVLAPVAGTVQELRVGAGDSVQEQDLLLTLV